MLKRDEVISKIKSRADDIRALGVESLFLYGSCARDEATSGSDVDVFVDQPNERRFTFREYTGLIHLLEDLFETDVDVSTRSSLHPVLRDEIIQSAVRVF